MVQRDLVAPIQDIVLTVHFLGLALLSECRICLGFALLCNFVILPFQRSRPIVVQMKDGNHLVMEIRVGDAGVSAPSGRQ